MSDTAGRGFAPSRPMAFPSRATTRRRPVSSGWWAGRLWHQTAPALAQLAAALVLGRSVPAALTDFGVDESALSPARLSPERTAARPER